MRFGTDGVRGRANHELTAELTLRLARASAAALGVERAVVGGDSRESTPMLLAAAVAGLASQGVEVHRAGLAPTPELSYHAGRLDAMAVVVSASHNPFEDNGVKVLARGGGKLGDDVEASIEELLDAPPPPAARPGRIVPVDPELRNEYVEHLLSVLDGRDLAGMPLVVDAANGAASELVADVFGRAGADVAVVHASPDGRNINAGCGATAPASLSAEVVRRGARAGIALDGDADRLIAVDERGGIVDGDHVMAICAIDRDARGRLADDTVVVTVMTNLGFRLAMAERGIEVVETPVGDRYVLEEMRRGGYTMGGEQSGHVIFADHFAGHAPTGDGMLTALTLLDAVVRDGRPLSELAASAMTRLPQVLRNVEVAERHPRIVDELATDIARAEDQLGPRGRVLVRPSGTEPLVRVMVEAESQEQADHVAADLAAVVEHRFALR